METPINPLLLDLVDWLAQRERTYEEAIATWRSARSAMPIWEEATRRGLVMTGITRGRCVMKPTSLGLIEGEFRRELKRQRLPLGSGHSCNRQPEG